MASCLAASKDRAGADVLVLVFVLVLVVAGAVDDGSGAERTTACATSAVMKLPATCMVTQSPDV
jgi:hypothetical protein